MKGKRLLMLLGSVCLILVLMALPSMAACAKPPAAETIELKLAHWNPPDAPIYITAETWAKEIEKRTEGKVKITIYPAQTLCKNKESYDACLQGITEVTITMAALTPGRAPLLDVMFLPLGLPSTLVSARVAWKLYEEGYLGDAYRDVHVLWLDAVDPGSIMLRKPVRTLEDFKGMKLRTTAGTAARTAEALGATPVVLAATEIYLALQKGVLDGTFYAWATAPDRKLEEVISCVIEEKVYGAAFVWMMNLGVWNSLPQDIQGIINECSGETMAETSGKIWDGEVEDAREYMIDRGVEIIVLSQSDKARLDDMYKSLQQRWVEEMEAKGLPGRETLEAALRFAKELQ